MCTVDNYEGHTRISSLDWFILNLCQGRTFHSFHFLRGGVHWKLSLSRWQYNPKDTTQQEQQNEFVNQIDSIRRSWYGLRLLCEGRVLSYFMSNQFYVYCKAEKQWLRTATWISQSTIKIIYFRMIGNYVTTKLTLEKTVKLNLMFEWEMYS